jgi:hypothetical protein
MEQEREMAVPGKERTAPTWRGFVLSILAAVVLSVMATLLLGGSWSSFSLRPAAAGSPGGCGSGGNCCPLPEEEGK